MPSYSLLFRGYYLISNMHLQSVFRIAWKRFTNFSPLVFLVKQVVPLDTIAADSFLRVIQLSGLKERVIVDLFLISNNRKHVCMFRDFFFYIFTRSFRFESVLCDQVSNIEYEDFIFWICEEKVDKMKCLILDYNWLN